MKNSERFLHIEFLQSLAIILVFLGHAIRIYYSGGWYFHTAEINLFCDILDKVIYSFHMPLFVFLSGYLFYANKNKITSLGSYFSKRTKRLLLPFYLAGFLYVVPMMIFINPLGKDAVFYYKSFINFDFCWHLWFLPMLYIVTIIVATILSKIKNINNITLIIFLLILNLLDISGSKSCIYLVPKYLIYFYLGALVASKTDFIKENLAKYYYMLLPAFFILEALLYNYSKNPLLSLLVAICAVFLFYLISLNITQKTSVGKNLSSFLSRNLFILYILHEPIMALLLKNLDWGNMFPPLITSSILFFATLAICITIASL